MKPTITLDLLDDGRGTLRNGGGGLKDGVHSQGFQPDMSVEKMRLISRVPFYGAIE